MQTQIIAQLVLGVVMMAGLLSQEQISVIQQNVPFLLLANCFLGLISIYICTRLRSRIALLLIETCAKNYIHTIRNTCTKLEV